MSDSVFKIEDQGNGYRFVTAPDFPGFSVMLDPSEPWPNDECVRILLLMVAMDSRAATLSECKRIVAECDYLEDANRALSKLS